MSLVGAIRPDNFILKLTLKQVIGRILGKKLTMKTMYLLHNFLKIKMRHNTDTMWKYRKPCQNKKVATRLGNVPDGTGFSCLFS